MCAEDLIASGAREHTQSVTK